MMDPYRDDPLEEDGRDWSSAAVGIGVAANVDRTEERDGPPPDNDDETIPRDELVDRVGG